jgi:hypothetical protein
MYECVLAHHIVDTYANEQKVRKGEVVLYQRFPTFNRHRSVESEIIFFVKHKWSS